VNVVVVVVWCGVGLLYTGSHTHTHIYGSCVLFIIDVNNNFEITYVQHAKDIYLNTTHNQRRIPETAKGLFTTSLRTYEALDLTVLCVVACLLVWLFCYGAAACAFAFFLCVCMYVCMYVCVCVCVCVCPRVLCVLFCFVYIYMCFLSTF